MLSQAPCVVIKCVHAVRTRRVAIYMAARQQGLERLSIEMLPPCAPQRSLPIFEESPFQDLEREDSDEAQEDDLPPEPEDVD